MKRELPKQIETEVDDQESVEITPEIIYAVNPLEQKYAQMVVLSPQKKRAEIAKELGIPSRKVAQFERNENVQRLIKHYQQMLINRDAQHAVNQILWLRERTFEELVDRFEEPDMDDLPKDASQAEKLMYLRRFAKNASFKDLVGIFKQLNDIAGLSLDEADEEDDEFVKTVFARAERLILRRKGLDRTFEEQGFQREDLFRSIDTDGDGLMVGYKTDQIEDGEIIAEAISIFETTRGKK